ncbi:MAG: SPOR domain-containing protein [Candidatus Sphingomonas colombiensis]|nr:SPOR domain-containing protein [Sphingomonas sp.]WEK42084.1 MAG: SPOR domain-containing protein [Sphingomonas sp.]
MTGADKIDLNDLDRLPWLESAEPEDDGEPGALRTVALVILGLLLLAGLIFGIYRMMHNTGSASGNGGLIKAPAGDYKIKPEEPGGLKVSGEGDSAIATSAGANSSAAIDLKAVPETPIDGRRAATKAVPAPEAGTRTVAAEVPRAGRKLTAAEPVSAPRAPVPGAGSGGSLVQLGAFPSEGVANAAWSALAKRFTYLATLGKSVQVAEVNGRKVYRLRVNAGSADAASDICGRLKVAGESCFVTS